MVIGSSLVFSFQLSPPANLIAVENKQHVVVQNWHYMYRYWDFVYKCQRYGKDWTEIIVENSLKFTHGIERDIRIQLSAADNVMTVIPFINLAQSTHRITQIYYHC